MRTAHVGGVKDGEEKPKMQPVESREPNLWETLEHMREHGSPFT